MQTVQDFDEFMEGVVIENRLRNRIAQLQEYVRMGITSVKEANDYEKQKVARVSNILIDHSSEDISLTRIIHFILAPIGEQDYNPSSSRQGPN